MRFIAFQRTRGHCQVNLLTGETLTHALGAFLMRHWCTVIDDRGWIIGGDGAEHPLQFIEREIKANQEFDELAVDMETCTTLNENSFEVRLLPEIAQDVDCATVLTSAEPAYATGEIVKSRMQFVLDFPNVDARAFFWYLRDGVLATFFTLETGEDGRKLEIIARYQSPPDGPWTAARWTGTYDDLAEQMTFEFPY